MLPVSLNPGLLMGKMCALFGKILLIAYFKIPKKAKLAINEKGGVLVHFFPPNIHERNYQRQKMT